MCSGVGCVVGVLCRSMLDNRDRVRVKTLVAKARFSSRSEAGRYAANMRWKGQGEQESAGPDSMSGATFQAKNSKGQIVVTEKNLSAPLLAEDAKEYKKDRKAALKAFGDVRNHIYALEIAVNAQTSNIHTYPDDPAATASEKSARELQSHLDELQDDVTSWKSAFDDAGDTPTVKGAIKMTAAVGLGETIKYHMQRVHGKTGWTGDKFEARATEFEYALQSAADKNFGVSSQKYKISDAIYRDIEQEDWA